MKTISSVIKRYNRKTSKKKSDGSKGEYTTTQYLVTLKKDDIESQNFEEVNEIVVVLPDELEALQNNSESLQKQVIDLQGRLIELQNVKIEYDKLENQHNHLRELNKKRERELNACENEISRLQNRGFMDIVVDRLRKVPAIGSKTDKEKKEEKN